MSKLRFERRLTVILNRARLRLAARLRRAWFQGTLKEYLAHLGITARLEDELTEGRFAEVCQQAEAALTQKISRARQKGYLKDYLSHLNMKDLLSREKGGQKTKLCLIPGGIKTLVATREFMPPPKLRLVG